MVTREGAWVAVYLISANVIFITLMGLIVWSLNDLGPGFAGGIACGAFVFFTYHRLKHGYWP